VIHTRFILIETSHAGNVGATARAMKVMGFDDLVLVRPRWANVLRKEETIQRSSGALDVLDKARIVQHLDDALDGVTHLCATAMTPRDFGPPTLGPREHLDAFSKEIGIHKTQSIIPPQTAGPSHTGIAFLFGSERYGMTNEDVYRCNVALSIASNPAFGSLNLSAAVQLIAYEWRNCLGGFNQPVALQEHVQSDYLQIQKDRLADASQLSGLIAHWQSALEAIGFLDPKAPKKLMPRLNQLFNRAQMTEEEIHIFRGIARNIIQLSQREEKSEQATKTANQTSDSKKDRL